jgi:hypothetical protein
MSDEPAIRFDGADGFNAQYAPQVGDATGEALAFPLPRLVLPAHILRFPLIDAFAEFRQLNDPM